jgi:hypothetical protein
MELLCNQLLYMWSSSIFAFVSHYTHEMPAQYWTTLELVRAKTTGHGRPPAPIQLLYLDVVTSCRRVLEGRFDYQYVRAGG